MKFICEEALIGGGNNGIKIFRYLNQLSGCIKSNMSKFSFKKWFTDNLLFISTEAHINKNKKIWSRFFMSSI